MCGLTGLVALLFGATATIGVAWQIAGGAPTFQQAVSAPRWSHASGAAWLYREQESFGATRIRGQKGTVVSTATATVLVKRPPPWSALSQRTPPPNWTTAMWEEAYGWPLRAFMARIDGSSGAPVRIIGGVDLGPHPRDWGSRLYLPMLPIWSGIAINTLVFSIVSWMLLSLLGIIARVLLRLPVTLRLRHGRCPNCGYDLRGKLDDGCSECGWRRSADDDVSRSVQR